jgi:hypothetical protein
MVAKNSGLDVAGKVYGEFASPNCDLASHRYFQEDIAQGLVLLHSLAESLGLAIPLTDSVITIASCIAKRDYLKEARRTVNTLGLQVWTRGPYVCINIAESFLHQFVLVLQKRDPTFWWTARAEVPSQERVKSRSGLLEPSDVMTSNPAEAL